MSEDTDKKLTKEERLAAKLRENLRRRKSQSREMGETGKAAGQTGVPKSDSES